MYILKFTFFIYSNQIKMMSKILFCSAMAFASVNAEAWDLQEEDVYGEPRLLDSVFNNTGHLILLCHKISISKIKSVSSSRYPITNSEFPRHEFHIVIFFI